MWVIFLSFCISYETGSHTEIINVNAYVQLFDNFVLYAEFSRILSAWHAVVRTDVTVLLKFNWHTSMFGHCFEMIHIVSYFWCNHKRNLLGWLRSNNKSRGRYQRNPSSCFDKTLWCPACYENFILGFLVISTQRFSHVTHWDGCFIAIQRALFCKGSCSWWDDSVR